MGKEKNTTFFVRRDDEYLETKISVTLDTIIFMDEKNNFNYSNIEKQHV